MAFVKKALLMGAVLAPPLPLYLVAPDPGSAARADPPAAHLVEAPIRQDDVYSKHCAPCHGKNGEGDGIAASAFNPPPADFTDRDLMSERTDEQLLDVLTNGKEAMPAFGAVLTTEELDEVLSFIRSLIPDEEETGG